MGKHEGQVWEAYTKIGAGEYKHGRVRCKSCSKEFVGQANKMSRHLNACDAYQQNRPVAASSSSSVATRTSDAHQQSIPVAASSSSSVATWTSDTNQQRMPVAASTSSSVATYTHRCDPKLQSKLDRLLGIGILAGGLPFGTFDKIQKPDMWEFIHNLNTAYRIPSHQQVANELLPSYYSDVRQRVRNVLSTVQYLNFTVDESDDKIKRRIANLSVNTNPHGAFFLRNYHGKDRNQTADYLAGLMGPGILEASNNDASRINSIATDTCATMRSFHRKLAAESRFAHVFFILCDSHGLQLLIKAILELPFYSALLKRATAIITTFSSSRLQLAILREYQIQQYSKIYPMILSVITRWGSQYGVMSSLRQSRDALRMYAVDYRASLSEAAQLDILDRNFWADIDDLEEVLRPIHEAQKMSESDGAHIGHVTKRWLTIKNRLTELFETGQHSNLEPVVSPTGIWSSIYHNQTTDIHFVAYYLDPANVVDNIIPSLAQQIFVFMRQFIDPAKWTTTMQHFTDFRQRKGHFNVFNDSGLWNPETVKSPRIFWQLCRCQVPDLAAFAIRIFSTPANSAPSERSFSAMNYIVDKHRTRLSAEHSEQSEYIYMNQRVLRRSGSESWYTIREEEAIQIEDHFGDVVEMSEAVMGGVGGVDGGDEV